MARLFFFGLLTLVLVSIMSAFAAGMIVPASNIGQDSAPVTAEQVKPPACDPLYLTQIISGSGALTGTPGNDLIIGSAGADVIDGSGGDDCILGGGGDDQLIGNEGTDICLGSAGTDLFTDCESEYQ